MKLMDHIECIISMTDRYLNKHNGPNEGPLFTTAQTPSKNDLVIDLMVKAMNDFYESQPLSLEGRVPGDHPTIPQAELNARLNAKKVKEQYSLFPHSYDPFEIPIRF